MKLKDPSQLDPCNFSEGRSTRLVLEFEGYCPITLLVRLFVDSGLKWISVEKVDHEYVGFFDVTVALDPKSLEEGLDLQKIQLEHLKKLKPHLTRLPRKGDGWSSLSNLFKR